MPAFNGNVGVTSGRALYIASTPETTFDTAVTPTHKLLHAADWAPLVSGATVINDRDYANGNITDFPTSDLLVDRRMNGTVSLWAGVESLPMIIAKTASNDTYGATGKHVIAAPDRPHFVAGTTIEEHTYGGQIDANRDNRFTGVCFDSWDLAWGGPGFATLAVDLVGTGSRVGTGLAADPANVPNKFLTSAKIRSSFQRATTVGNTLCDAVPTAFSATAGAFNTADTGASLASHLITKASLKWSNGLTDGRHGGTSLTSDVVGGMPFAAQRSCLFSCEMILDETSEVFMRAFQDRTAINEWAWMFDFAGHTTLYGGCIQLPITALLAPPVLSTGRGPVSMSLVFDARKSSLVAQAALAIMRAVFHNGDAAAYSAAAA